MIAYTHRTLQALMEAASDALLTPPLQYRIGTDTAPLLTVPAANIHPREIWSVPQQAPTPLVAFLASTSGSAPSRGLLERELRLEFWILSSKGGDECREIYEAIRPRFHTADQEAGAGVADLSRAASTTRLSLTVRECIETEARPPAFDNRTERWQMYARYRIVAI